MVYPHCAVCKKIFRTRRALDKHIRASHHEAQHLSMTRVCNICKKSFLTQSRYHKHLKSHANYLRCDACGYVTTATDELSRHVKLHVSGQSFCGQCNMFYDTNTTHKHTDIKSAASADKENKPTMSGILDYEGGGLELEIPLSTLEECTQLMPGQSLQLSGKSLCPATNGAAAMERDISVFAVKRENKVGSVCFVMQNQKMNGIFQRKLKKWHCQLSSSHLLEPASAYKPYPPDDNKSHQVETLSVLAGRVQSRNMARIRSANYHQTTDSTGSVTEEPCPQVQKTMKTTIHNTRGSVRGKRSSDVKTRSKTGRKSTGSAQYRPSRQVVKTRNMTDCKITRVEPSQNVKCEDSGEDLSGGSEAGSHGDRNLDNSNHEDNVQANDDEDRHEDPNLSEDVDSGDDATWTLPSSRPKSEPRGSKPGKRKLRGDSVGRGRPRKFPRKSSESEKYPKEVHEAGEDSKIRNIHVRKQRRALRLSLMNLVKGELNTVADGNVKLDDAEVETAEAVVTGDTEGNLELLPGGEVSQDELNTVLLSGREDGVSTVLLPGGEGEISTVLLPGGEVKQEIPDPVSDELKDYITIVSADKNLKAEVLRLNASMVTEMIASGADGTAELAGEDLSQQIVCIVCMRKMRKNYWFFFCCHLEESHVMTPQDYHDLLLMENTEERNKMVQKYQEKQVLMKQRYKQIKYNVSIEKLIQCPGCPAVLTAFGAFCAHIRTVHSKDDNYSELVAQLEEYRDQRLLSAQRHGKLPPVKITCDYCGIEKLGLNGIKVHMGLAHPKAPDMAAKMKAHREYVRSETLRLRRLQYHSQVKQEKEVFCRFCGEKYSFRSSRGRHEKYSCEKNPDRIKTFTCQYCDNRFISKEELDVHRQQHKDEDFKFVCDMCGLIRRTKAGMYEHKKSKHGTQPPKHKCPYCEKSFYNKDRLQSHITVHSDHRAFQCELCGSNFKTRASVTKHQNAVHLNKYTYYCDKCGHGMAKRSYLKAHKCGRIRRNQVELDPDDTSPIKSTSTEAIVSLPDLALLPKMEGKELVYASEHDKGEVILETEIATHILMGSSMDGVECSSEEQVVTLGSYGLDHTSQPLIEIVPHHMDVLSRTMDMVPHHLDTTRSIEMPSRTVQIAPRTTEAIPQIIEMVQRPVEMVPRTIEYSHQDLASIPQVSLLDYTHATQQILGTRPMEMYRSYQTYQPVDQQPNS